MARSLQVRSIALTVLAVIAVLFMLYFTRSFFLPICVAILGQFVLSPLVRLLHKAHVPPSVGAGLLLLVLLGAVGYGVFRAAGPALDWTRQLPTSLQQVEVKIGKLLKPMAAVTKATEQVENLASKVNGASRTVVTVERPGLAETLLGGLREFAVGAVLAVTLLYFMLAGEDSFLRKLVRTMPRMAEKRVAVETMRGIQSRISTYLLTISAINLGLGLAVGTAMYLIGMPNPFLWGAMAGILNFIPYLGAVIGIGIVGLVSLLSFDSLAQASAAPLAYFLLIVVEGMLITPMIVGFRLRLSPVAIFVWLLLWDWLWGFPGALIAVPMLVAFKILCDNLPRLAPIGRFLAG